MSRRLLILANDYVRSRAMEWIRDAPANTRVEFKDPRRSLDQNAKMWATLTDISEQVEHCGRKYSAESWKAIFMNALGRETEFAPSLDGDEIVPLGYRSSELSKDEMCQLIEFMSAWGATHGVIFNDPLMRRDQREPEKVA